MSATSPGFGARLWIGVLSVAAGIVLWAIGGALWDDPTTLPSPLAVWKTAGDMALSGALLDAVLASLERIAAGYVVGAIAGIVAGLLLGGVQAIDDLLGPIFEFMKGIPPIALVPIMIMWLGIGELPKYLIVAYIVWVVVTVSVVTGVREIHKVRRRAGWSLGLSGPAIFLRIILPSAAPYLIAGLHSAVGFAYIALVSAELIASRSGVGFIIMDSRFSLKTSQMIVGLITLGVMGALSQLAFDFAVGRSRWLSRYRRH